MNKPLFPDVIVNGTSIPSSAIGAEAQNHPAPKGKPGLAWKQAARALVLRQLLLDEAARRSINATSEEVATGRWETQEEAQIRALMEDAVEVDAPNEGEVRAEWEAGPERFMSPPLWEVSHILFTGDMGEKKAIVSAAQLAKSPKGFGRLARDVSECPSASSGGALGQLGPGDTVPEFEAALRQLSDGEVTPTPVQTRFGWHLIRLDGLAAGQRLPYDVVQPKIAAAMEKARWARAAQTFAQSLVEVADIIGVDLKQPVKTDA